MCRCILSIAATDALVLKHQAIDIYNTDELFIEYYQFCTEISHY